MKSTRAELTQLHQELEDLKFSGTFGFLLKENPQLAKNPAVLAAVRAARTKVGQGVAKR